MVVPAIGPPPPASSPYRIRKLPFLSLSRGRGGRVVSFGESFIRQLLEAESERGGPIVAPGRIMVCFLYPPQSNPCVQS
ncbi:hypothetical protein BHE74_00009726 [Ensete ventricosum]|nr:hypothetical protein BHE74_00009726 [Ensete ventricosum]RZS17889.1 hypothetical protein BHM03_00050094 [Ensete ventricosum]